MYLVEDLLAQHGDRLSLKVIAGAQGLSRQIKVPEAQRPGLSLSGYLKNHAHKRILIFGKVETNFIRDLDPKVRTKRLESLISEDTPAVVIARGYAPPKELSQLCEEKGLPLLRTQLSTMNILTKLIVLLHNEFAPTISCHGTLVEVFGVGVLIQGESAVGKSEAALGLIERGHRLISDDIVKVKKRDDNYLEGSGAELTKHHLEIRGIGIINVANLYGVVCVREHKSIDIVVQLELWDDLHFYDRVGVEDKTTTILGHELPFHVLPVKPGRDVVLLLETIARNHRLRKMGYNSAKEFQAKLTETISRQAKGAKR
ncbi:MAG: HPr(Ser) kinase/phosphatase [Parachlamydiaceae bacterium]